MPFNQFTPRNFTNDAVLTYAPVMSGVYGISNAHEWIYIGESDNIQNSLLKFNDLQDFHARMVIVADSSRKPEYQAKLAYAAFRDIAGRVKFLDFESLVKQYELVTAQASAEVIL